MKSVIVFFFGLFLSFGALANSGEGDPEKDSGKSTKQSLELAQAEAEKEAMQEIIRMGVPDDFKTITPKRSTASTYDLQNLADKETLKADFIPSTAPSYGVGLTIPLKK
ncbi:hypothetical protein R9C00_28480 [Flammeovirgaceae bacterium SG7u.111]|nr:hypothetical protein [Flammeovirgaceae bacterium SG7u.132]WPO35638.1 hypothetical protein R9C00_28480 [Flammeovirgaceae bacterium SG7u.111]